MISDLYLKKLINLVPLSFFDLTDNMCCLFQEKSKFEENNFLGDSVKNIFQLYSELDQIESDELSKKIQFCSLERQKYFDILLSLLNKMDYAHNISFEKEISALLEDELEDINYEKIVATKDFPNLLNTCLSCVLPYVGHEKVLDYLTNFFIKSCSGTNLYTFDSLLNSTLNKVHLKFNLNKDVFNFHQELEYKKNLEELSEISELSLKYFQFCQYIFNCYSNFIALYTYIEEFKLIINDDLIVKDIYYTTKKIVTNNEKIFLEKTVEQVEYFLDQHFEEKEKIEAEFAKAKFNDKDIKVEYKYIDSIANLLNETPHYVGEFLSDKEYVDTPLTDELIRKRVEEFLTEFNKTLINLSYISKTIAYMSLINNVQVGLRFYKVNNNSPCPYSQAEVQNIIKYVVNSSDEVNKKLITIALNKFVNY